MGEGSSCMHFILSGEAKKGVHGDLESCEFRPGRGIAVSRSLGRILCRVSPNETMNGVVPSIRVGV